MLARYVVGLLLCAVSLGPIALAAFRLSARAFPAARGAWAVLAAVVLAAGLLVIALEIVGVLGAFDRLGVVLACAAVGLAGAAAAGSIATGDEDRRPAVARRAAAALTPRVLALAAIAVVSASWVGWTLFAYHHGMETVDTLWYHLPTAARFVQNASILHLQYFDSEAVTVFYPANAELFHAFALLMFGTDLASPAINLGWAALALLAAWAIGARYDRGPHCVVLVAIVLVSPALVDTQPGGAYNDIVGIALLLSAAALLIDGHGRLPASALAAVAAGLALGTKFTMIVPAIALAAGAVAVAGSGRRRAEAGVWILGLLACGGYWYLRNWVLAGNPVPSVAISLGPLSLPAPSVATPSFTVFQYLTDGHVWRAFYIPGLRRALGPAWWAIIPLSVAGAVGAVIRAERIVRMLGVVTLVSMVAYALTPQFLGLAGAPIYFVFNVRYVETALALGLVLLPIQGALAAPRRAGVLLLIAGAAVVATELDPGVWPTGIGLAPFATPLHGGSAIAGAVFGAVVLAAGLIGLAGRARGWRGVGWARRRTGLAVAVAAGLGVVVLGGGALADTYAADRYRDSPPLPGIYRWARTISHARIGIVGFTQQYPLYGSRDSNYVQYLGAGAPHRGFGSIVTCQAWRRAVNRGRYRWLVIAPAGFPFGASVGRELGWTSPDPAVRTVITERSSTGPNERIVVLRIDGALSPGGCVRSSGATSTPVPGA